jgi:hypothetical protein
MTQTPTPAHEGGHRLMVDMLFSLAEEFICTSCRCNLNTDIRKSGYIDITSHIL